MKNKKQVRQGDVLVERLETNQQPQHPQTENGRVILAHGEVTGHAHEIAKPKQSQAKIGRPSGRIHVTGDMDSETATRSVLSLGREANLIHQEHGTIALEEGSYVVTRQREYSPEAIRNVAD